MKKLVISILFLFLSTSSLLIADTTAEKNQKTKECAVIMMVETALGDLTQTVCFTSTSDHKKYNSLFDIEGRITLLKNQIKNTLGSESDTSKKLTRIISQLTPPNKYRINGEYEYTKYSCNEVSQERDEALEQVKEIREEICE